MRSLVVQESQLGAAYHPGVGQIIAAYDLDKDGRTELIGIKAKPGKNDFYNA